MDCSSSMPLGTCPHCSKIFSTIRLRNRHIKRIHKVEVESSRSNHILCPICGEGNEIKTFESLRTHIENTHEVSIEYVTYQFSCSHDYEVWRTSEKIEVNYAISRCTQRKKYKEVHYDCNRSNIRGYQSKNYKRTEKSGGTIKICGICPSKLIVKIDDNECFYYGGGSIIYIGDGFVIGETHDVLKEEDFALGFMNSTMEDKLRNFPQIICMDGTHGTNTKKMDLTVMLIKDDKNAGFPVAFFLSNRLDQQVQEVFLGALKEKLQQEINAEYFMSDDDPKYYNAWIKTMVSRPRRLLCTWHVVKNWNIQGKKKIKDANLKNQMKTEMKRILNETNKERFLQLTNAYLEKLQKANEVEFLNYLLTYYFHGEERIEMWAHCHRKNAGINTNMAIESFNNLLKTNQLKRKAKVTVEKLLDTIEDLVDIKMWQRILNIERPNANNYQDRIIIKAHRKAEAMKNDVNVYEKEEGKFYVKSSRGDNFYNIHLKQVCESECRTLFCRVCKICMHRYQCDCPEYTVRNTMCKHVHLVRMHEERKGTNSVLDSVAEALGQHSQLKVHHQQEITQFIEKKSTEEVQDQVNRRSIQEAHLFNWVKDLDDNSFETFMKNIQGTMKDVDRRRNTTTRKRKMEKQGYFPAKKR
ncbi:zinc ion binding protein [Holotrichia oblita]|uniref:Zinc ion binding protein n=1 Tax=Holotrichia oblita TaxID=644536 RepID=A0ACB9T3J7_HOLOL|nr:zinc ion binding protein [Holotrichia oblita]